MTGTETIKAESFTMFAKSQFFLIALLVTLNTRAEIELSADFYAAQPNMQLYMAYAEFKMAHYGIAREMSLHIIGKGSGEAAFNLGSDSTDPMLKVRQLIARGEVDQAREQLIEMTETSPPDYEAVTRLAWLYETGLGGEQDIERAGELFMVAAEGGNAEAQYALSVMNETGVGSPKDAKQSLYWLKQSAGQHYQQAVEKLNEHTSYAP